MLGTSSQVPTRHRNHNGYLLRWDGEGLLFDPGDGNSCWPVRRQVSVIGGDSVAMQAVQRSTRRNLSTAGSRNRRSIGTLQPAAWVWSVQRGRAARLAAEQSPESSSARISRAPSERQLRSAQGEDAHTCWSGALDLGNHKFLADLGHGDSLRQQAPTVNPCSAVLHSPSPNARRARYGLRWEDAEVAEDAGVAQARMLVGLLRYPSTVAVALCVDGRPVDELSIRPHRGDPSRRIAASVLRGAPTPRRPLSPIPRSA